MVVQYKCPNCGADMSFDAGSGMLHCESCGRSDKIQPDAEPQQRHKDYESASAAFSEGEALQYQCRNCGAVLMTDQNTAATTCSFCGAGVVLGDRLAGSLAPLKVIPFIITKEQAQQAFRKWCKKGLLTPKAFRKADRVKSVTGIYVPFWLYDLKAKAEMSATCTKVRHYTDGNYNVTETRHYKVFRRVDVNYLRIPVDASAKMNDSLMDRMEPFYYKDLKEFRMPYLAGYLAEKYDQTDVEMYPRAKSRAANFAENYIQSTIHGYSTVLCDHRNTDISGLCPASYTLLPIWMVCYDYKDSEHIFAMNGQTGKICGKPPISKGRIAAWFAGISALSFAILEGLALIFGGRLS